MDPFAPRPRPPRLDRDAAEAIAARALGFLAAEPERLGLFLDLAGLDPSRLRAAAAEPGFLAAVLDHVASDEALLLEAARALGEPPERIARAQALLSPAPDPG